MRGKWIYDSFVLLFSIHFNVMVIFLLRYQLALYCGFSRFHHLGTPQKRVIRTFTIAVITEKFSRLSFRKIFYYISLYVWVAVCVIPKQSYKFDVEIEKPITSSVEKALLH